VGLVLLAFLDCAVGGGEIRAAGEALHALADEVAVGHRVAQHADVQTVAAQIASEPARDRGFAAAGPEAADRDHGAGGGEHGAPRTEQGEVGTHGERARGEVHDVGVRHVAVGEDDLVHALRAADFL